ncbi:MAG TPA: MarR family transcriptional regulator [Thermoleophilaceae bacterium]|nr:MarR family transcriptional regulator [Thermoleophilaceae bacterium]
MTPTQRVWLPPHPALARHTAYLALELAAELRLAVDAELREAGLTWADFKVLAVVTALEGPSQEAIHDRVGVDRGSLSRLVNDLEYEGLIERHRGHQDGRRVYCSATPAGVAVVSEAAGAVDEAARKALRFLLAKERARLHVLMERALDRRDRVVLRGPRALA